MATKGRKHKHNIEDTPLDISKMKTAMKYLVSLKELGGIQEMEGVMDPNVMKHVRALEKILENVKNPGKKSHGIGRLSTFLATRVTA